MSPLVSFLYLSFLIPDLLVIIRDHEITASTVTVKDSAWPNAQSGNASRNEVPARKLMD